MFPRLRDLVKKVGDKKNDYFTLQKKNIHMHIRYYTVKDQSTDQAVETET